MSTLHAHFALRNHQAFARALDAPAPTLSSSASKRPTAPPSVDVNARDWLGRTVLHLACAATEPFALDYVRLLLAQPHINVNLQDTESRWTPLHRALYAGNLAACVLLLQRSDTDTQLRDYDGYTPFDLYNSTVDGTQPSVGCKNAPAGDLFTWGANRNAALGHGDADDRTYPDQVVVHRTEALDTARFTPVRVKAISMAKLHTTIITDEKHGNLRACGFGSGGRLGPGQHTQYALLPVPHLTHQITALALGQDHTLALTSTGEVLSWGLNRFAQLGYAVDPPAPHTSAMGMEEPIQAVPRRVVGLLRREEVVGVEACKTASACWTEAEVFTWGTNAGQLGYDRAAQPVQVLPRKVTGVQGVTQVALTDSAMACLLDTMDVICFRDDAHFRVKFPAHEISELPPYLHPHVGKPAITKITRCDDVFGALSTRGDVFTFAAADGVRPAVKPQRVWALRKAFDPAMDIALGSDGDIILCTASGHVFVRTRHGKGKSHKFHRVPFIHRAVRVCANSTGAFAALRVADVPRGVRVVGSELGEDMAGVRPWVKGVRVGEGVGVSVGAGAVEDEEESAGLDADVHATAALCALLAAEKESQRREGRGLFRAPGRRAHGADMFVQAGLDIPAHRVILAARSPVLRALIAGTAPLVRDASITVKYHTKGARLTVTGCQSMTVLLLLEYLYTDDVPALWDRRVGVPCAELLARLRISPAAVKAELEVLARVLELPVLGAALEGPAKRVPRPTLSADMERLFLDTWPGLQPDVVLELADREVACHSVVLRARSVFFQSMFDEEAWTVNRRGADGVVRVDLRHMRWRAVEFVVRWVCWGEEGRLFEELDSVDSVSDLLDLMFSVMAVASELLLDKLMLICSSVVLRHVTLHNISALLADATYYNALPLVASLQAYVTSNMEAIMESRLLEGMPHDLIKDLSAFVRRQQTDKLPAVRSGVIVEKAMRRQRDWLELQDIPQPVVRSQRAHRDSPRLSPVVGDKIPRRTSRPVISPFSSPVLPPTARSSPPKPAQGDEIFAMEDEAVDAIPALNIGQPQTPPTGYTPAWKSKSVQAPARVDMKAIMAEAETGKGTTTSADVSGTPVVGFDAAEQLTTGGSKWSQKPSQRDRRKLHSQPPEEPQDPTRRASGSGSPWKLPPQQASTSASPVSVSIRGPQMSSVAAPVDSPQSSASPAAKVSRPQPATPASILQASNPALGPVFSPAVPGPSTPGSLRRTSSDAPAWNKTPVLDVAPSPISGLSFAAIQQQQRDKAPQPKGKRSLREIQEEERARQEEEDFLRWWTAEEERLKAEAKAETSQVIQVDAGSSSQRGRGNRRGRGGGVRRGEARGRGKPGHSTIEAAGR